MMTRVAQQYVCTPCHWTVQFNMAKIMFYIMRLLPHTHIHTKHLKQMWWNGSPIIFFSFPIYLQTNSSKFGLQCTLKNLYSSASNFYISQLLILTLQEEKKNAPTFSLHLLFSFSFMLLTSLGGDLFLVFSLCLLISFHWEKWASPLPSRKEKYSNELHHPSFIPCPPIHMIMQKNN